LAQPVPRDFYLVNMIEDLVERGIGCRSISDGMIDATFASETLKGVKYRFGGLGRNWEGLVGSWQFTIAFDCEDKVM